MKELLPSSISMNIKIWRNQQETLGVYCFTVLLTTGLLVSCYGNCGHGYDHIFCLSPKDPLLQFLQTVLQLQRFLLNCTRHSSFNLGAYTDYLLHLFYVFNMFMKNKKANAIKEEKQQQYPRPLCLRVLDTSPQKLRSIFCFSAPAKWTRDTLN